MLAELILNQLNYRYYSLTLTEQLLDPTDYNRLLKLPYTIKILIENIIRNYQHDRNHLKNILLSILNQDVNQEIFFQPSRVLLQDFTGVPVLVDLAALRDAMAKLGGTLDKINPNCQVDLVIDHSVQVDYFGDTHAFQKNVEQEFIRNGERYRFLKWASQAFNNVFIVPPGTGICHQVNLEYLAKIVWNNDNNNLLYPDSLVGTDSHTTMVNALGVLGWGVGGIEAEAAMLGEPITLQIPIVVGVELTGELSPGVTATDLVLTITQILRKHNVTGKFVEYYGTGLDCLTVPDRATIANMSPEYGATCGFFPVDQLTLDYFKQTGRSEQQIAIVKKYCQIQKLWRDNTTISPEFTENIIINLNDIKPCMAGPKRPQDRIILSEVKNSFIKNYYLDLDLNNNKNNNILKNGDVVIAAITSCTNTSNPTVMLMAGLVAKKAIEKNLKAKPWVKTSLAPGSKVVAEYLEKTALQPYLNQLGFNLVGFGCTTCIGNSGPLDKIIADQITQNNLTVCAVLSGNRNFEGRIHPLVRAAWLASPPLVVIYALTGSININLDQDPIGYDQHNNQPIYFKDLWPTPEEIKLYLDKIDPEIFKAQYKNIYTGDKIWQDLTVNKTSRYDWDRNSTYIQQPSFLQHITKSVEPIKDIVNARLLALLGDSVTTDHISPAGSIAANSPAGQYLKNLGVDETDFNSYGARRGNHEVMVRGTFANIRLYNELLKENKNYREGGYTYCFLDNYNNINNLSILSIYDAAIKYQNNNKNNNLIIIAGRDYGMGSSRDWAAKGTALLGVRAVIVESFERIHRSNLIGMGVLPLEFLDQTTRHDLNLQGDEQFSLRNLEKNLKPKAILTLEIYDRNNLFLKKIDLRCRIDTEIEFEYYRNQGILNYTIRRQL